MSEPNAKTYDQRCPLAIALDHVGDRWTMLIVRELLAGPGRFGELRAALPGIASNLLAARLRRLEATGVVERRPPDGAPTYALTPLGQGLREPLEALGRWGALAGPVSGSAPRTLTSARSVAMGLESMLRGGEPPPARRRWEMSVDDEPLTIEIGGAEPVRVRAGRGDAPDARFRTTMERLADLPVPGPGPTTFEADAGSEAALDELLVCLRSGLARAGEGG